MKILHISDTHGKHHLLTDLPQADVIIHSGDMSENGTETELLNFINWFCELDYSHKIFVAGNHDTCLYGEQIEGLPENCHYLCYSGVIIENVNFFGVPLFMSNEFMQEYDTEIERIPFDTNVLITHEPPYCILDQSDNINYGNYKLLKRVLEIKPKYHLFGHIHNAYGFGNIDNTTFVNASVLNEANKLINKPILLEV